MKTFTLGIDIGSISLKTAVLNSDRETVHSSYSYTEAQPRKKLLEALNAIRRELGNITFHGIVCTGSGKKLFTEKCGLAGLNEIVAHARSCWETIPDVRSLVEIGGQDSKFITIGRWKNGTPYVEDFSFNGLCSAGTGAFLDQQSERLGLAIEDFAELAHTAESVPAIAGRCSVFAKSDMIHLQQKGTGKDAIAAGLCFSLARNYLATLCRGKIPEGPVAFQGGVAANRGMLRAFSQIFNIPEESIIVPRHHKIAGAHGGRAGSGRKPASRTALCRCSHRINKKFRGAEKGE